MIKNAIMRKTDSFLVGFDCAHGEDKAVLIVGRKEPNEPLKIVNSFQGEQVVELYKKLGSNYISAVKKGE